MRLDWKITSLALRRPFRISRGQKTHQTTIIVRLSDEQTVGYGEASPSDYYGIDLDRMQRDLSRCAVTVKQQTAPSLEVLLDSLRHTCLPNTFALSACDIATHDLFAKRDSQELSAWLDDGSLPRRIAPRTSITIGLDSLDEVDEQLDQFKEWPILKVKLGGANDLEVISHIRKRSDAVIRVDANGGWDVDQAILYSRKLADFGVEFIEQPIPPGNEAAQRHVKQHSALPVIADESCLNADDVQRCVGLFDGINIKLSKCGGIREVIKAIRLARQCNLKVMIGCMTESGIAMAAGRALASYADAIDLDGSTLMKQDIASGFHVANGQIALSCGHGLGIETDLFERSECKA